MMEMESNHNQERIDVTLGDLIEALTEAAFEFSANERDAYVLAALAMEQIFKRPRLRDFGAGEVLVERPPEKQQSH